MGENTQPTALETALREARRGLAVVGGLSLFLNLLVLVSPLYMFQVFDRVLPSGHIETLVALTVAAAFALLVFGMLEVIRRQALVRIGAWLDRTLAGPVLAASVGEALVGRAIGGQPLRDLAQLRGFISSESVFPIFDAPWTLVFIAVIWLLHPWLGALALVSSVLLFALALGNELVMRGAAEAGGRALDGRPATRRDGGAQRRGRARHGHAAGPAAGMASGQRPRARAPCPGGRPRRGLSSASPSSCGCSSRSGSSASAPVWCWAASSPAAA